MDVFRVRQYFNVITRMREVAEGIGQDVGFLDAIRRALVPLPFERHPPEADPFPPFDRRTFEVLQGRRLGVIATGGSGALASVVGVARAMEESGVRPDVISLCSGSALFGFPVAAGVPAGKVANFTLGLRPEDYVDVNWAKLLTLAPTAARGFAGIIKGQRVEQTYRRLLGDMTLGEMPIPAYAPIWNIEQNRLEYLGPSTYPDMPVARAVHMAVALPLFIDPVPLGDGFWCDGGIVDILPVHPVLDIERACDTVIAVNGFYPPDFVGEDGTGWQDKVASILHVAAQVRTCQHVQLARENLARLQHETDFRMITPVPYGKVRGVGFYLQFLDNTEWGGFMRAGRDATHDALRSLEGKVRSTPRSPRAKGSTHDRDGQDPLRVSRRGRTGGVDSDPAD